MWRKPFRNNNEISQTYTSGVVKIYDVEDVAAPGRKPTLGLSLIVSLRYEEERLGIQRYYNANQNQVSVERVIRVPFQKGISNQNIAITEDGTQYGIDLVQSVLDVFPKSLDITLTRIEQKYGAINDEMV